jgi:hypothetical protein
LPGSAHAWSLAWERLIPHREGPKSEVAGQQGHISGSLAWTPPSIAMYSSYSSKLSRRWSALVWEAFHGPTQLPIDLVINRPRPHDRSGRRPRCPWQPRSRRRRPTPGPAAVSMQRGEHRGGGHTASIRADREEGRRALPPDEHHLAVEGHTQSLRPEGQTARCSSGAPPDPDQTIDLKARPHLTIGSRNRSGLLRRKTTR